MPLTNSPSMIFQSVLLQIPQANTSTSASYCPISGSGSSRISVWFLAVTKIPLTDFLLWRVFRLAQARGKPSCRESKAPPGLDQSLQGFALLGRRFSFGQFGANLIDNPVRRHIIAVRLYGTGYPTEEVVGIARCAWSTLEVLKELV